MMVRENDRFDQRELRVRRTAANRGDQQTVTECSEPRRATTDRGAEAR